MVLRRFWLVVSLVALTTVVGAAPIHAGARPPLVLVPASGPAGTTVTVSNDPGNPDGLCSGGILGGTQEVDVDVAGGGDEIVSSDPQFAPGIFAATGNWTATFTVPAGLAPGDKITVSAVCTESPFGGEVSTFFEYLPTVFTVTAGATTSTTTRAALRPTPAGAAPRLFPPLWGSSRGSPADADVAAPQRAVSS